MTKCPVKSSDTSNLDEEEFVGISFPAGRLVSAFVLLMVVDLAAVMISAFITIYLRAFILPTIAAPFFSDKLIENTIILLWWYPFAFLFSFAYDKLYTRRLPFWIEVEALIRACTLALFIGFAFIYLSGLAEIISRAVVLVTWILAIFIVPLGRYYGKHLLLKLKLWVRPVILIGTVETAERLERAFEREKTMGYRLIGYVSPNHEAQSPDEENALKTALPSLGYLADGEKILQKYKVNDVVIALPGLPADELVELTNRFQPLVKNIMVIPDLFGITMNGIEVTYFFEEQTLFLQIQNRFNSLLNRFIKRLFDLTVGTIILLLSLPLLLVLTILVKISSPGPALFIQKRVGQNGSIFRAYKFRTMYIDCDQILSLHLTADDAARFEWHKYKKLKVNDPRVTSAGRLMRRFSMDELPQIFNVIKNEMSLVGPRPYLPEELHDLHGWARDILITKPGLTGLWQVSGRNKLSFKSRLRLDAWYVRNWSLWLDIVLILRTVRVVFKTEGAY